VTLHSQRGYPQSFGHSPARARIVNRMVRSKQVASHRPPPPPPKTTTATTESAPGEQQQQQSPPPPRQQQRRKVPPGTVALREIRTYQRSTDLLIPKAPFARLVREITQNLGRPHFRCQTSALEAIQQCVETHVVQVFEDVIKCALHANRVSVRPHDLYLALRLRDPNWRIYFRRGF
jgi:histone H3